MIPAFVKRLSSRLSLSKKPSEKDATDGRTSLSRRSTKDVSSKSGESSLLKKRSTLDKVPLSRLPTIQLEKESSTGRKSAKSSRQVTFQKIISRKSSSSSSDAGMAPSRSLSKKLTSASKSNSLTSKPILAGRAPSLTSKKSKERVTKKTSVLEVANKKKKTSEKTLWFPRMAYVTVRNDDGSWFLCRLQQNVYNTSKSVKIRWLSKKRARKGQSVGENEYELDYRDEIDPACILFSVRVTREKTTFTLLEEDRLETEKLLKVVTDVARGNMGLDDVDSDVEEVVQIEPPSKKRKVDVEKKEKVKGKKSTKSPGTKKERKEKTPKDKKKAAEGKEPKRKVAKKKDELTLHPNPAIKVQKKDPFFESNQSVPFISKYAHSRLVFRAVYMKDYKLLKKLVKETERVRGLSHWRSASDQRTALHHAAKVKDIQAFKLLMRDYFNTDKADTLLKRKKNSNPDKVNVAKLDTGSYNFRSLGVAYIRPIMASRGSREGNNALTKDLSDMRELESVSLSDIVPTMFEIGLDFKDFKDILTKGDEDTGDISYYSCQQFLRIVDKALERGNNKLAGEFMKYASEKYPRLGRMSSMHYTVLISDKELKNAPPSHVHWGLKSVSMITPVHCAACNPDTQYLERLLKVEPDVHISDKINRRPIHFAAGCSSSAPLELLIKRGANIYDCDRNGRTPLMFAVQANRLKNIHVLMDAATKRKAGDEDPMVARYGLAGINRPKKDSSTPLHIATENNNLELIKYLLKSGALIDAKLNTSRFKITPLMTAAQHGFFDVLVFLIDNGAVVQQKDRLGRTALIHAAMNGNTNVLSYLLNIGANPNLCDNSGNSPLHYAAAYGWYFCVKTLLEAGANVNVGNDWKTTPLSITYMKAHTGIVHQLLQDSEVDVDFQDDEGLTLVSTAASSALYAELYDQIHYLVKDRGASCTYKDVEDATPLHHLAANDILLEGSTNTPLPSEEAMDTSVKIARLLVEGGCDVKAINKKGSTAAMVAMRSGNLKLFKFLVESGCPVLTELDKPDGDNILHHLCYDHMDSMKDYLAILKYAAKVDGKSGTQNLKKGFRDMTKVYCHDGSTPLLAACQQYSVCKKAYQKNQNDDRDACRLLWKRGREFIKFLIDEFGSDVNAVIREKYYEKEEDKPKKEEDRYQADWGKWSVAEMLADTEQCEYAGEREDDEPEWPALRMILKYKPDMNTRDNEGHTALTGAVDYSKIVPATLLVKESNADVNAYYIKEENGKKYKIWTVVIAALTANQILLELIVEAGADLNVVDERDGAKPLHAAIIKGDKADGTLKMMRTLLDHGADVDVLNKKQRTPLHLAVDYNAGNMNDNFDLVLALINKGAKLNIQDIRGRTPLHYVFVKTGNHKETSQRDPVELMRILASRMTPAELNIQDKFGMTALHRAAYRGANICCMYLLQKGANVNVKDKDGNTPLTMAMKGKHDGCATVLIQNGACLKDVFVVEVKEDSTATSSDSSDEEQEEEEKKKKLKKKQRPVWKWAPLCKEEKVENVTKTPLFEYAIDNEFQGVCFMVMDKPVKESGITFSDAIEIGLKLKKYNIVLRLLSTTSDVSSLKKDREHGQNLLHKLSLTATTHNSLIEKVVNQLGEKGVSLTKQDQYKCTPLLYAALKKNYELCKFYMKTAGVYNPKYTDSFNRSVLGASFWNTSKAFDKDFSLWLQELLERKGNLNELIDRPFPECLFGATNKIDDPDYWQSYSCVKVSPLIISILFHNHFLAQWILQHQANPNQPDMVGKTPMMHAVIANNLCLVKTLMNYDFDPFAKDEEEEKKAEQEQKKKMQSRIFRLKRSASKLSQLSKEDDSSEESEDEEAAVKEKEKEKEKEEREEKKELKPYKKISKVDLNAVDKNGWTVIHYAVCPLSFGTYDNDEIVFILAKAGAKLNVKNKKGDTPLDLALRSGAFKIAKMIQELEGLPNKNMKEPKYSPIKVDDGIKWKTPQPSFHEDAERLVEKLGKPMEVEEEYEAKIDPQCDVKNGTLVKDEEQGMLYDVLLTKVDVNCGEWGLYNFYQIQLVHQRGKDLFVLFTRWGRIGDNGQFQHTPYQVKEEGIKEFCKIFRAKTGNKWTEVKSFENKPRKYRLVQDKERRQGHTQTDIEFESKSTVKTKLPEYLQHVMEEMTNMKSLKAALKQEKMDSDIMPFGRMQRDRLLKARVILQKISGKVSEVEEYRQRKKGTEAEELELKEKYQKNCEEIAALSSEYFQVIPQKGFSFEKIRPLDSMSLLKKEISLVSNLLDYEVASRMLLGAKYREKEVNMLDYAYHSLGCKIQKLAEGDVESQYILRYIVSSAPKTKVEAIYRLEVKGEQARMDKKSLGNHRLLFHGSGVANFLSILNRGLVIAPPDVAASGALFGKGIYFSDSFTKSHNYCSNLDSESNTFFMLLCEVSLGKTKQIISGYVDRPEKGYDSLWVIGKNRPKEGHNVVLPTGCMVPLGENEYEYKYKNEYLLHWHNEYIVYDEGQVCLRYLIQYTN